MGPNYAMTIVKVGGGADIDLSGIAEDLSQLISSESRFVIVLGANAYRAELAQRLGLDIKTVTSVSGVSSVQTDDEALELLTLAYAGRANKRFVELCQARKVNAVGLSGLDGGLIRGERNRGIRVMETDAEGKKRKRIIRDRSGKPVQANATLLRTLLGEGYTPVITVPIMDESGRAMNTDNDSIVTLLQRALGARSVIQLLEAPGLMRDLQDPESLVAQLSVEGLRGFRDASEGRFQRKLMAISNLLDHASGCEQVILSDGREPHPIQRALDGAGTRISSGVRAL